jgi:hypothetical protein
LAGCVACHKRALTCGAGSGLHLVVEGLLG